MKRWIIKKYDKENFKEDDKDRKKKIMLPEDFIQKRLNYRMDITYYKGNDKILEKWMDRND